MYRVTAVTVLLTVLASACGGEDGEMCAARSGIYRADFAEAEGTCGVFDSFEFDAAKADLGAGCSGHTFDHRACTGTTADWQCVPSAQPSRTVRFRGAATWDPAGARGDGEAIVTLRENGQVLCESRYIVTFTRL